IRIRLAGVSASPPAASSAVAASAGTPPWHSPSTCKPGTSFLMQSRTVAMFPSRPRGPHFGNMPDVSPVGYIHTEVRKEASNEIARLNREVPGQGGYYKEIALRSEVWRGKLDQCAKRRLSQIARADGQPRVLDHGMRYAEAPARGLVSARKQGACIYCTRNGHYTFIF